MYVVRKIKLINQNSFTRLHTSHYKYIPLYSIDTGMVLIVHVHCAYTRTVHVLVLYVLCARQNPRAFPSAFARIIQRENNNFRKTSGELHGVHLRV